MCVRALVDLVECELRLCEFSKRFVCQIIRMVWLSMCFDFYIFFVYMYRLSMFTCGRVRALGRPVC